MHQSRGYKLARLRPVAFVGPHQLIAHLVLDLIHVSFRRVMSNFKEQLAGQRITVGMQAVGGQPYQNIAHLNFIAADDLAPVHNANNEAGKIIFAARIEARHLRRLAADQGAIIMAASLGHSFYHFFHYARIEHAGSQVVHEEKWSCALHGNIVYAVVDQIGAHGVMQLHHERYFQLSAYAVHAGDQNRIAEFLFVESEQPAESTDFSNDPTGEGAVGEVLDALFGTVRAVNVNPALGIGYRFGFQNLRSVSAIGGIEGERYFSTMLCPRRL